MSQLRDQKMKTINMCQLIGEHDDKLLIDFAPINFACLLWLSFQSIEKKKHMLYLVKLFERNYHNYQSTIDLNTIIVQIEEALQFDVHEHEDFWDYKYLDVFVNEKQSMIDIIQQIINNTQFQQLQGNDSLHVCILEQLLKLSEICSYKYQFITIIEIIQKHFKLSNDQDLYIKASTQLILLNSDLTGKYIDDLTQFQEYNIKSFALLGNFLLYLFGRKQSLTGEHFRAIETLSTVIVRDRKNSDNYYQFGIALYYDEQYEEALAAFDISQKLNYNIRYMLFIGLQIIQILGSCYYQLKCYILPLSWINRVLNLSPQNKDALFLKCNICKQKEYIQSNDFGCNLKEIVEIRYKIQTLDIVYLERYNQSCKILQSQFNEFNSIFDINMAILISKYCPIKFFEPQEFEGQIQQGKFSQYMKTIKVQPHPQLLKSEQDNDNDCDILFYF